MRVFLLPKRTKPSQSKAFVSSFGAHPCSFSRISTQTFGQKPECRVNLVQQSPLCVDSNAHINTRMLQRKCRGISQIRCHSRINPLSLAAAAAAVYKRRAVLECVHFFFGYHWTSRIVLGWLAIFAPFNFVHIQYYTIFVMYPTGMQEYKILRVCVLY